MHSCPSPLLCRVIVHFAVPLCASPRTAIDRLLKGHLAFHLHLFDAFLAKLQSPRTYKYSYFSIVTSVWPIYETEVCLRFYFYLFPFTYVILLGYPFNIIASRNKQVWMAQGIVSVTSVAP